MNITTIGIDLAKTSFSLVGAQKHGKIALRKTLTRNKLLPFIALRRLPSNGPATRRRV